VMETFHAELGCHITLVRDATAAPAGRHDFGRGPAALKRPSQTVGCYSPIRSFGDDLAQHASPVTRPKGERAIEVPHEKPTGAQSD
jgi:hypothetical protein